ncbi:hypothetical protein AGMMS50293_20990 [Spirochaetia bacterium]|nr:hypothetical protein AGMMS50293_20990 [Spirochaetia bacterium]
MKNNKFLIPGMAALALTFALVLVGCGDGASGPSPDPELPGTITISPDSSVTTGDELTANYSGSEDVSYQWNKDGNAIPTATNQTYTPYEMGSYTVTVSAAGYQSKTSAAVIVTGSQWRSELIPYTHPTESGHTYGDWYYDSYNLRLWIGKNNGNSYVNIDDFAFYDFDFYLLNVDDKPAGQYSSFTIKGNSINPDKNTYTITYKLAADNLSFEVTNNSGFSEIPTGIYELAPPSFWLRNIDSAKQAEGSYWTFFGLFPTGTSDSVVLADAKAQKNGASLSTVVGYVGNLSSALDWAGDSFNQAIQGPLYATVPGAGNFGSYWFGSGAYDAWLLGFNGSVWNGYKLVINVPFDVTISAQDFTKEIDNQP